MRIFKMMKLKILCVLFFYLNISPVIFGKPSQAISEYEVTVELRNENGGRFIDSGISCVSKNGKKYENNISIGFDIKAESGAPLYGGTSGSPLAGHSGKTLQSKIILRYRGSGTLDVYVFSWFDSTKSTTSNYWPGLQTSNSFFTVGNSYVFLSGFQPTVASQLKSLPDFGEVLKRLAEGIPEYGISDIQFSKSFNLAEM